MLTANQGGISFFSHRVGFVSNNIVSYEIVLADGTIATASETTNSDLWRALKGGSNNFGIVTSFTARSFPTGSIWGGFFYMFSSKAEQITQAFYDFTEAGPRDVDLYDEFAAGPIVSFAFVQQLGLEFIGSILVYNKPEKWPKCFDGFKSIGRFWNTAKVQSVSHFGQEMAGLSPLQKR